MSKVLRRISGKQNSSFPNLVHDAPEVFLHPGGGVISEVRVQHGGSLGEGVARRCFTLLPLLRFPTLNL